MHKDFFLHPWFYFLTKQSLNYRNQDLLIFSMYCSGAKIEIIEFWEKYLFAASLISDALTFLIFSEILSS